MAPARPVAIVTGGARNLGKAIALRLARDGGRSATSAVADLGFALFVRGNLPEPAGVLRPLLDPAGFDNDLAAALEESDSVRLRFAQVAQTGLMLLRQPEGQRRRVGGAGWGEKRLFESVRQRDADFVLLAQALRELRQDLCDLPQALDYARQLPALTVRCRWLSRPSPFAAAWTQAEEGAAETALTPGEALLRLHAELMGGDSNAGAD